MGANSEPLTARLRLCTARDHRLSTYVYISNPTTLELVNCIKSKTGARIQRTELLQSTRSKQQLSFSVSALICKRQSSSDVTRWTRGAVVTLPLTSCQRPRQATLG